MILNGFDMLVGLSNLPSVDRFRLCSSCFFASSCTCVKATEDSQDSMVLHLAGCVLCEEESILAL